MSTAFLPFYFCFISILPFLYFHPYSLHCHFLGIFTQFQSTGFVSSTRYSKKSKSGIFCIGTLGRELSNTSIVVRLLPSTMRSHPSSVHIIFWIAVSHSSETTCFFHCHHERWRRQSRRDADTPVYSGVRGYRVYNSLFFRSLMILSSCIFLKSISCNLFQTTPPTAPLLKAICQMPAHPFRYPVCLASFEETQRVHFHDLHIPYRNRANIF